MNVVKYPNRSEWPALVQRPVTDSQKLDAIVSKILKRVKQEGDKALFDYTRQFDRIELKTLLVSKAELAASRQQVSKELMAALRIAVRNIRKVHRAQSEVVVKTETTPGVICWRRSVAIERVGLYIPGGSAPLFSTVLMLGIPAKLAGCKSVYLCTPPDASGHIDPAILVAAELAGITSIYKVGGAQAIAAMAYGTESVPKADKIFGPGNQYVTCAKQLVNREGLAIDLPAGPSELAVLADDTANPAFVAADLLSQAEHGPDSQVILVTTSNRLITDVQRELQKQLQALPRKTIAQRALESSRIILVKTLHEGIELVNSYAPEHLIVSCRNANRTALQITCAGSVFIGPYSAESAGDYASGTNHTLPTNGYARAYSGVSLDSFVKKISYQFVSARGLKNLGKTIETMATAEKLDAHKHAISIRLNTLN